VRLYRSTDEIADLGGKPRAVAIGTFDGVHLGHQEIIRQAVAAAVHMDGVATVLTFEPHPDTVLRPGEGPGLLTTLEQKVHVLGRLGVAEVVAVPFTPAFSRVSPEEFCARLLSARLGARQVMVGDNFHFGFKGAGAPGDLLTFGLDHGFSVTAVRLLESEGGPISSTRIRESLRSGEVALAGRLLGRPFALEGPVVSGVGRGRGLGVPTANLPIEREVATPALGVYITRTSTDRGAGLPSVTSVGTNPTFESDGVVRVETFLLDFSGALYGERISVAFLERLRGQQTFASADALVEQMHADIARAHAYFAEAPPPNTSMVD
jgi:riboflavin kinase / FMN adenylyltransferase